MLPSAFKSMTGFLVNDWLSIFLTFFRQVTWLVFRQTTGFPSFRRFSVKWLDFQSVKNGATGNKVIWRKNIKMMENQSFAGNKQVKSFDRKTSKRWKISPLPKNQSLTWKQMEALSICYKLFLSKFYCRNELTFQSLDLVKCLGVVRCSAHIAKSCAHNL